MDSSALADWTRQFAVGKLPVCKNPSPSLIRATIGAYLPEQLTKANPGINAEELLQSICHISVIVKFGREKVAWVSVQDLAEAEAYQEFLGDQRFSKIRRALGISMHWILLAEQSRLAIYGLDHLTEAAPDPLEVYESNPEVFRIEDRQECMIVRL